MNCTRCCKSHTKQCVCYADRRRNVCSSFRSSCWLRTHSPGVSIVCRWRSVAAWEFWIVCHSLEPRNPQFNFRISRICFWDSVLPLQQSLKFCFVYFIPLYLSILFFLFLNTHSLPNTPSSHSNPIQWTWCLFI